MTRLMISSPPFQLRTVGIAADVTNQGLPQFSGKRIGIMVGRRLFHAGQKGFCHLGKIEDIIRTFIGINDDIFVDVRSRVGLKRL